MKLNFIYLLTFVRQACEVISFMDQRFPSANVHRPLTGPRRPHPKIRTGIPDPHQPTDPGPPSRRAGVSHSGLRE